MEFVADLHLHSKYSRAVSQQMILPEMAKWAVKKGIDILTTGDWTHPLWLREIKSQLEEKSEGLYGLKSEIRNPKSETNFNDKNSPLRQVFAGQANAQKEPLFLLSTEIASIYKQGEKLRRIHNLVFAPNFETAEKINKELLKRGCNLSADGRPIIGLSSRDLLELALNIDKRIILIPCHVWTPHFGIYGSASGFDSLDEAFEELSPHIFGIETGLSSDPEMNWQIEELKSRCILSFSDAHSLPKMGREATVFVENKNGISNFQFPISNEKITYDDISKAIKREKDANFKIGYTIEFYPEEGKYHFSGHRNCKVVFGPEDIKTKGNICPVCKRRLTEGVLYRLNQLSKESLLGRVEQKYNSSGLRWYTDKMKIHPPFVKLVPLNEIVAESMDATVLSEKVKIKFDELCLEFGSEIKILLKTPLAEIEKKFGEKIAEGVAKVRKGDIFIDPGYDGEYGKVKIWSEEKPAIDVQNATQEAQLGLKFSNF